MTAPRMATGETLSERNIVACNFRSAGRLSNDSARHLRSVHESFARNLSHSLDLYLGSALEIKLLGVDQTSSRDFTSSLVGSSYLVPFVTAPMQDRVLVRFDSSLSFPLLDLLLGGTGEPDDQARDLTDLDEELLRSVTELVASQLERAWKSCQVAVTVAPSIKPAVVGQIFATEERVALVHLEMTVASTTGAFDLVLPMAFANALIRGSQTEATRRVARQATPGLRLRDRVLHCTMQTSAELHGLRLSVGDLVGLRRGDVLDLRAPVATPVRLSVDGHALFEVTPVRHGRRKAAQLGRACEQEGGTKG